MMAIVIRPREQLDQRQHPEALEPVSSGADRIPPAVAPNMRVIRNTPTAVLERVSAKIQVTIAACVSQSPSSR